MPGEGTQVLSVIHNIEPCEPKGLNVIWETTLLNQNPLASYWQTVTGSTQGSSILADVTYNQTANIAIKAIGGCPKNCRPYVTNIKWAVNGATAWTTGQSVTLQDSSGNPFYYIPLNALKSYASQTSGAPETPVPAVSKTVVSYVASTGVITFAASSFTASAYKYAMGTVVAGTGIGQSFLISDNGTATITAVTPPPIALDSTSVVAVWYGTATSGSGTTLVDSKAAWPTLTGLNYYVVIVAGTGAGTITPIASNTSTTITATAFSVTPDNTSVYYITNNPQGNGVVDMGPARNWSSSAINTGVFVAVNGSMGAGSPIRFLVEGFWSF